MELRQTAACYRADDRWSFQVLWRCQQGQQEVMSMADEDGNRLQTMSRALRREEHGTHACLRVREHPPGDGAPHSHLRSRFWKTMPEAARAPDMAPQAAAGARRVGTIPIAPEQAQPERQQPHTLDECRRCELWQHATQAVPGEGAKKARIMLVGEQPGDQEDLQGHPFVGPAGALLDRALAQAGVDRGTVYVTNAVKHFKWEPRGKRRLHKTPAQKEILACHYWLEGELEQIAPQVVVALGSTALKAVLEDSHAALKDYMGQPVQHAGRWVIATYHPAYVLRVPGADEKARALAAMVDALRAAAKIAYE
jgi:DNA polymerase